MSIPEDIIRLLESKAPYSIYESKLRELSSKDINFVVVGAMDGVSHDRLYPFASKNINWSGLLIEPIKGYFDKMRDNYSNRENLKFENVAIAEEAGTAEISLVDPERIASGDVPEWTRGISSLLTDTGCISNEKFAEYIVTEEIVCERFDTVAKRNQIENIDVLQIDAEGYDALILNQVLECGYRPELIFFEVNHLNIEDKYELWMKLKDLGYVVYPSTDWTCVKKK